MVTGATTAKAETQKIRACASLLLAVSVPPEKKSNQPMPNGRNNRGVRFRYDRKAHKEAACQCQNLELRGRPEVVPHKEQRIDCKKIEKNNENSWLQR